MECICRIYFKTPKPSNKQGRPKALMKGPVVPEELSDQRSRSSATTPRSFWSNWSIQCFQETYGFQFHTCILVSSYMVVINIDIMKRPRAHLSPEDQTGNGNRGPSRLHTPSHGHQNRVYRGTLSTPGAEHTRRRRTYKFILPSTVFIFYFGPNFICKDTCVQNQGMCL